MADALQFRRNVNGPGSYEIGDQAEAPVEHQTQVAAVVSHQLDSEAAREEHRKLLSWYYYERDRQAANRMEMATDADFYDGMQWDDDDKAVLADRGQMALVYNEVSPMCDWITGTERRARVDWKVLPRAEDDVDSADIKTKVLKYVSDVNKVPFARSRAFGDAIKVGIGWVDDGVRDDPSQDPIYSRYEDWRNVLMDSTGLELCGDDARYIFRWRWVDEDIAVMMFPDRAECIKKAVQDWSFHLDPMDDEDSWRSPIDGGGRGGSMSPFSASSVAVDAQRRRVKLIECQFRKPTLAKYIASGPLRGAMFDQRDRTMGEALKVHGGSIIDKMTLRVHVAVFTEASLLCLGPSVYRHNKFSLTPVVCYRSGRDRQWYGAIRRVRSIQQDLNKRASKALHLLNTNQIIADKDAFEDIDEAREQAQNPQGMLLKKTGSEVVIRRDTDAATGQLQLMTMAAQSIQKSSGVTDENLGRKTNAISGEAIRARQSQGSVVTTEPFDNLRLTVQAQGEKQLSLVEQFYSEEKVIRLTGAQGAIDWVRVNQPEVQPDGSVRWLNDITASIADFVVSEADYAGTLRQVMFDSLMQISQRLPPEIALKLLRMAYAYSDLPNKDEIADEIRKLTGDPDPTKKLTPEEEQQAQQQQQMQAEAMQMQRETAMAALEEQRGKARVLNAEAEKVLAEIDTLRAGPPGSDGADIRASIEQAVAQVRDQAAQQIDQLSQRLAKATASNEAAILKVRTDADTAQEIAHIDANAKVEVATIQAASEKALAALTGRLDDLAQLASDVQGAVSKIETKVATPPPAPPPVPPAPPAPVVAAPETTTKSVIFKHNSDGKVIGADVVTSSKTKSILVNLGPDGNIVGGDIAAE